MRRINSTNRHDFDLRSGDEACNALPLLRLWLFAGVLGIDALTSSILLTSLIPMIQRDEGATRTLCTLSELAVLALIRLGAATFALVLSYYSNTAPESPFDMFHANGEKKTREELDNDALEEPTWKWFRRNVSRPAFAGEAIRLVSGAFAVVKSLARLNVELGVFSDPLCPQPIEPAFLDAAANLAGEWGRSRRQRSGPTSASNLSIPLLSVSESTEIVEAHEGRESDEEEGDELSPENVRGVSDITDETDYTAKFTDLLALCLPDSHLIITAFVFLFLAAIAQVYIPRYTGNILDALTAAFHDGDDDFNHKSIWAVPGFVSNVEKLVAASVLGGVFAGIRGSIFTVGERLFVRLRVKLMDSLLTQDLGFFDVMRTEKLTSRLSNDTAMVGDTVMYNVNVFLRSLVQALGVLALMFTLSWQLTLLAFISVSIVTVLSIWYGKYEERLSRLMQSKLADGNALSEATIGSMPTVRAFGAAEDELYEFEKCMEKYLALNLRSAVAYFVYSSCVASLPQVITAIVLFFGGLLIRNDAFDSIGDIFSSLTQAVGASNKVFELINRKPRLTPPSRSASDAADRPIHRGMMGMEARLTSKQQNGGICPDRCLGEVKLKDVELFYPARPQHRVLHGFNLSVQPGQVVALVGPSGSGKTSVMSLIHHLYEPSTGNVLVDGHKVCDLSPQWLARHVSIVSQEPTLFARSIRRNIMYGLEGTPFEPSEEEIKEAAKLANASSFIEKLPRGYETDVGKRGVQLSGGQKQRIAIARALVRKPRVLLLDEATSALDAESEALVQEAIDDMIARGRGRTEGMTVLISAHRLSTIQSADVIFVVQDGRVVEQGSHDDLLANPNGAYRALISRQLNAQLKMEKGTHQEPKAS